jgi:hypothetical protein
MPPAFNLSQDQTLQFDLEFAQRNRSELHFCFHERLQSCDHESSDVNRRILWHSLSNAHAYRLYVVKELFRFAALISNQRRPRFWQFF